jgi:NAD(P)-dependent dehydrogenase (short-subunit alcohol dehydrogenase family)
MVDSWTPSPDRLFDLSGKIAVVTGATGVLGGAMARGLAQAGARVSVLGRRKERAEEITAEVENRGGEALALPADVLKREQLEAARDAVLERWGRVDVLVNAAGGNVPAATVGGDATFFGLAEEPLREVFDLNLLGTVLPSQVFGEAMTADLSSEAEGSIVNISSMAALKGLENLAAYSAAKGGVNQLTRVMAVEWASRGVRVNAFAPGYFENVMSGAVEEHAREEKQRQVIAFTPMRRRGRPEELVGPVVFLASEASSYVTGAVLFVDGGYTAQ